MPEKYAELEEVILRCIQFETGFDGMILPEYSSHDIDGWDSIAHIRIIFRINSKLNLNMDIKESYGHAYISELVDAYYQLMRT